MCKGAQVEQLWSQSQNFRAEAQLNVTGRKGGREGGREEGKKDTRKWKGEKYLGKEE